jgi:hypothetical protein
MCTVILPLGVKTIAIKKIYHITHKCVKVSKINQHCLTLSNPIFLPTAYSPALICYGRERGWWITCNYTTVLEEKNIEKQKECSLRYLLPKVCTTWGKALDRLRQWANATKTVSDVFRHWSGTGKSYCRTRSDVGSERVNPWHSLPSPSIGQTNSYCSQLCNTCHNRHGLNVSVSAMHMELYSVTI